MPGRRSLVKEKKQLFSNIAAAAAFFALGAFWYAKSYSIKVTAMNSSISGSPRTFPQIISVLIMAVSIILIVESLIKEVKRIPDTEANGKVNSKEGEAEGRLWKPYVGVTVVILASILYCAFISKITYLPASILFMAVVCWFFEIRKPLRLILLSILVPGLLYVVFRYLLVVPLP